MKMLLLTLFFTATLFSEVTLQTYEDLKTEIKAKQQQLQKEYVNCTTLEKDSLLIVTEEYLFTTLVHEIFPRWYGTPWEFYGKTLEPQEGSIACGYFVTHTLSDLGFKIPKVKWAQSASEYFIKKLAPNNINRFSNKSITEIEEYLKKKGDGIYLVGLDCHVGFIVVEGEQMKFIHSSYYRPEIGVMSEDLDSWNPLRDSKYRVVGKLLSKEMVEKWIRGVSYN